MVMLTPARGLSFSSRSLPETKAWFFWAAAGNVRERKRARAAIRILKTVFV